MSSEFTSGVTEDVTRVEGAASVPLDELSASASASGSSIARLDRLGRYRLLDLLGRGAFGAVWTAFDPKLDRKVAIKVVHARRGAAASAAQNELLREAQLLAQLSHPNVVAIHDVGSLEEVLEPQTGASSLVGVFIVMEHLSGPTLTEWLIGDEPPSVHGSELLSNAPASTSAVHASASASGGGHPRVRSDEEILRVFIEAGRGLQAAHARDLVHLDFKPGNVMFGADGRVRVLDFGLAQVSAREREPDQDARKVRVAGTPAYMAPEQHEGKLADARADQYAFCLSLWEALVGQRPFVGQSPKELFAAKLAGPPKLGAAALRLPHVQAALERGLSFDPAQRFASMAELLATLEHDPRVRRRRVLAGIVVVGGLLTAGFGLARASNQSKADPCALPATQFEGIWDEQRRAEVEAAFAATKIPYADESFQTLALALDEQVMRWSKVRREVCEAALVEATSSVEQMSEELLCLDRQLRSVAGVSAALLEADAEFVARAQDSVRQLDDPQACRSSADEDARAVVGGARRAALLEIEDALARARVARELGRYVSAIEAADQALARARELDDVASLARSQRERAASLLEASRSEEALAASMDALTHVTALGDTTLETRILINLLAIYTRTAEYGKAATVAELTAARLHPGVEPELAMLVHLRVATMHERQQHWDEALAQLDAGLALAEAHPDLAPVMVAELHLNYGNILLGSGRDPVRGEAEYRAAISGFEQALGVHHPHVARARMNLGTAYFRRGELAEAIELFEAALAEFEQIYPTEHPFVGNCHQNLGAANWALGDLQGALRHTRESVRVAASKLGRDHPDYASTERNLAAILLLLGEYTEACELYADAERIYLASLDAGDSRRMAVNAELAECAWWRGDHEQGQRRTAELELALAQIEAGDLRRIGPLTTLALFAAHAGDHASAERWAEESLRLAAAVLGPDNADVARARALLAEVLREAGQLERAASELEQALAILDPGREPGGEGSEPHMFAAAVLLEAGRVARAQGQLQQARERLERARSLAVGPSGSPITVALIDIELAGLLEREDPQRAASLRAGARASLERHGVRPDLQAALAP